MSKTKEVEELVEKVKGWDGWRVERTKMGWMAYPPDKSQAPISIHKTPSDRRAHQNTISRLRRAGGPI